MPWVRIFWKVNMTRDEILRKLEENRETIRGFGVRRLGIFGSYARDEHTKASDMDFLVEFDESTFDNYFDLKFVLEDLFGSPVDLVFADTIKPRIRSTILEETIYAQGFWAVSRPQYIGRRTTGREASIHLKTQKPESAPVF
jgi:hypothetical protein